MLTDSFLSINSLPNPFQCSFHTTTLLYSIESAILKVSNDLITGTLNGTSLEFILLNLAVAFTNVDHLILFKTLSLASVRLPWLFYLFDYFCFVSFVNSFSSAP